VKIPPKQAIRLNRSSSNLSTLAQILAFPGTDPAPRQSQERALALIQEAVRQSKEPDAGDLFLLARIAGILNNDVEFRAATSRLLIDQSIERSAAPVPDSAVPTFREVDL